MPGISKINKSQPVINFYWPSYPLLPDTVTRWIKEILVEASTNLKAKNVRSLAVFYA